MSDVIDDINYPHWIIVKNEKDLKWACIVYECSRCHEWQTYGLTKYCPDCGRRMIGKAVIKEE